MPDTAPQPAPDDTVGPLQRGLAVLRALGRADGGRLRHSELARGTELARSTVDRAVATLCTLGLVSSDGREAELAPQAMRLGGAYLSASGIPEALGPLAERLADEFDESVSVAVPDGDGVRFVLQTVRRRTMSLAFRIGDLLPAERCAPGALFAAEWDERTWAAWRKRRAADPMDRGFPAVPPRPAPCADRFEELSAECGRRGWAGDDQLIEPGLLAVAVPVRGPQGQAVCAVSVVSHTSRYDPDSLRETVLTRLREAAGECEAALAAHRAAPDPSPGGHALLRPEGAEPGPGYLQSLARGLSVLTALGAGRDEGMTLSAVAGATGLARATARRSLLTLEQLGYAASDGRRFRLLPRVLELGYASLSDRGFPELVQPHMAELVKRVGESASMAVLDGQEIVYVARVPTVRIMSVNIRLGTRFPAYATSMGRVLLAGLGPQERAVRLPRVLPEPPTSRTVTSPARLARIVEETERRGYALVDGELEEGLRSLAVPVHDASGRVVAALNLAQHSGRGTPEDMVDALLPALRETAAHIESDLRAVAYGRALPPP
ncbi:IclR family transcriptional regulator C-terminal domain-containing protein [Streptomyces sp. GC420]|uniref:IclR family transcriptional regulator domain-containing protein n=1 Tax=Streptomyces sp. GC420 TaxID=2697568 RepID=UPI001414D7B3|nr:IclR family transcriptional regulator C-terminal domain-containing protein [Streptomyces sp. GC420]NBM15478.1 helix-turn-helix domain-containing protein [Streptomyces sp. GC420]